MFVFYRLENRISFFPCKRRDNISLFSVRTSKFTFCPETTSCFKHFYRDSKPDNLHDKIIRTRSKTPGKIILIIFNFIVTVLNKFRFYFNQIREDDIICFFFLIIIHPRRLLYLEIYNSLKVCADSVYIPSLLLSHFDHSDLNFK